MGGFDDLEEAMEEQDSNESGADTTTEVDTTGTSEDVQTEPERDQTPEPDLSEREESATTGESSSDDSTSEVEDALEQKAFTYAEAKQSPVYAREEAWEAFDDTMDFEVKRELRDRGIRNVDKRELHETMFYVAAENPELMVERFLELRRES